jgi:hypothetical protein
VSVLTAVQEHLVNLNKLRTSNHKLAIQQLRHAPPDYTFTGSEHPGHGCKSGGAVHDEHHMMFDCPTLAIARLQ